MKYVSAERWSRIEHVLDAVLDLSPAEQRAVLERTCADDPDLRRDVEKLLYAEAKAPGFLEVPAVDQALPLLPDLPNDIIDDPEDEHPGKHVGPYRILRELGRGGMSVVYLAERDDGLFDMRVAVKVLRRDLVTDDLVQRFEAERRILAGLDHPNVAHVYDGGLTDEGRPYFVMEYVDGVPIDTYCDTHKLSIDKRLRLFLEAADAVQQAHRHFVVHRDIKPSNIFVKDGDDGQPHVRLLDFGIAKLIGSDHSFVGGPKTVTGQRWMTPEYAAPEQVRGEPVTTATDVYALGVVLYELLTGHRPYSATGRMPHEVAQAVLEQEPSRPSAAITRPVVRSTRKGTRAVTPEEVSDARGTSVPRLRKKLRGDLDTIVLKALRKEPTRRYSSVEGLVEDVQRYLSGRPVEARPDTLFYRTRKFGHRHRWGVAMSLLVTLIVAAFTVQTLRARNQAEQESAKSARVAQFMSGLLQSFDPSAAQGGTVHVEAWLDHGVDQVNRQLADQPDVQASVLNEMGTLYQSYGLYEQAQTLLEWALRQRRALFGDRHLDVAESQHDLARLYHVTGRYDEAEALQRQALDTRRALLGNEHTDVAASLNELGLTLQVKGEHEAAEALMRESLEMRRALLGLEHPDLARGLSSMAFLMLEQGRYDESEALYRDALDMSFRVFGDEHLEVAENLNSLAALLQRRDRYDEAEPLYRQALAMRRKLGGDDHPHVAQTLSHLGLMYRRMGRYDEAETALLQALDIRRNVHGEQHLSVANTYHQLGWLYYEQEAYAEGEPYYLRALDLYREVMGPEHRYVATALNALGLLQESMERYDEAEAAYREALAIRQKVDGPDNDMTLVVQSNLGLMLQDVKQYDEAQALLEDVLERRRRAFPGHWRIGHAMSALGGLRRDQGHYEEAETMLTQAFEIMEAERGIESRYTQGAVERLVGLYEQWDKPFEAASYRAMLIEEEE